MIPQELANQRFLALRGDHRGSIIRYPFGVVFVSAEAGSGGHPLSSERFFSDIPAALRGLRVDPKDCVRADLEPERRFRIVVTKDGRRVRTKPFHTYMAACMHIARLEWQIRLEHSLLLPFKFSIEDTRTALVERPQMMSDLGQVKNVVHRAPPSEGRPNYLLTLPSGAAAIWTGKDPKEEFWVEPQLMLHQYGLNEWPEATTNHDLPESAIVRPDPKERLVVAEGYHSVLHAARVSCWIRRETGVQCLVDNRRAIQGFDDTIMWGDVVRMTSRSLETYKVETKGGVVALVPDQVCEVATSGARHFGSPTN